MQHTKSRQFRHSSCGPWPKRKFSPSCTLRTPSAPTRICCTNFAGVKRASAASNERTSTASIPVCESSRKTLGKGRDQLRRLRRPQNLFRVRIKSDRHCARARLVRLCNNARKNLPVAQVHAVEVADRRHRTDQSPPESPRANGKQPPAAARALREFRESALILSRARSTRHKPTGCSLEGRLVSSCPRSCAMCVNHVCRAPMRRAHCNRLLQR